MKTAYSVGIYCRLSREDLKNGRSDVSLSIDNQQAMLEDYVNEKGWKVYKIYIEIITTSLIQFRILGAFEGQRLNSAE